MNLKELHTLGIDIGSTTVKIAMLDEENEVLFSDYERHYANIQETYLICSDVPSISSVQSRYLPSLQEAADLHSPKIWAFLLYRR